MKKDTKQKILESAVRRFNEDGYVNVRLQHIADEASMSIGNLNYHFKHKVEILTAIYQQIQEAQESLWIDLQQAPIFEYFDHYLRQTFQLQQTYTFFYLDTLEMIRASEEIAQQYQADIQQQERQLMFLVQSYMARGAIRADIDQELSRYLARQMRNQINLWPLSNRVEGVSFLEMNPFRETIWLVIKPYMTTLGLEEFSNLQINSRFEL